MTTQMIASASSAAQSRSEPIARPTEPIPTRHSFAPLPAEPIERATIHYYYSRGGRISYGETDRGGARVALIRAVGGRVEQDEMGRGADKDRLARNSDRWRRTAKMKPLGENGALPAPCRAAPFAVADRAASGDDEADTRQPAALHAERRRRASRNEKDVNWVEINQQRKRRDDARSLGG
uniref:Uncharacterized protein n=1 Tax=Plectus sambesii TaxID=2011161 RepID=A0A914WAL6_9BILA